MNGKTTISRTFFYLGFLLILVFSLGGAIFVINHEFNDYKSEVFMTRGHYIEIKKSIIKKEVQSIIQYISYRRSRVRANLEDELRDRTYETYNYALDTYNKYRGTMPPAQIKELIKSFLKSSKYKNGRGYYFAIGRDGLVEVNHDSQFEGQNALDLKDCEEQSLMKELGRVSGESGEGVIEYRWSKPNQEGCFPKVSFVKYFEPFGWYIGTGEYLDQIEAQLHNEVLQWLNDLHASDDSYIAVCTFDGVTLASYNKKEIGSNRWDIVDPEGAKIVQERIRLARECGSGSGRHGRTDSGSKSFLGQVCPTFDGRHHGRSLHAD